MTTDLTATINGQPITRLRVNVPNKGPWHADADVPLDAELAADVTIKIGTLTLIGRIVREQSGTFQKTNVVRVVAGGAGWQRQIPGRPYHNDAGVRARLVAEDAARECGERLGNFEPAAEQLGADYVRNDGPAARTLEAAAGPGVAWWVDYAGLTHVGKRAAGAAGVGYTVLAANPRERVVMLSVEDPAGVVIGSTLTTGLDEPGTVRELQLAVDENELRVLAWVGGDDGSQGRLAGLLRGLVERSTDGQLWGLYKYRCVRMAPGGEGRAELQAVRRAAGLPDITPISLWPGVAGIYTELAVGAEVLVQFVDGDRGQPVVTHFAGPGGKGFVPAGLTIGGDAGPPAARQGDAVEVLLPPAVFSGTISGAPASGVLTFPAMKAIGVITAGSAKVKIAT